MIEKTMVEGTITNISNKISTKGQAYSIFRVITLEGEEIDIFRFDNNLSLLNKVCKFEIESTIINEKQYNRIIEMEVTTK